MRRIFEQSNIIFPAGEIMMVSKKINYITGSYTNQMTEVLANIVTDAFGFKDIHDKSTEIGRENLINAIPKLQVLQPLLVEAYKSTIKECYDKGLHPHTDAAKLLRRILKKHYKALIWRRTTIRNNGKCIACYKYRMT